MPLGRLGAAPHRSAAHTCVSAWPEDRGTADPHAQPKQTLPLAHVAKVALISEAAVQAVNSASFLRRQKADWLRGSVFVCTKGTSRTSKAFRSLSQERGEASH